MPEIVVPSFGLPFVIPAASPHVKSITVEEAKTYTGPKAPEVRKLAQRLENGHAVRS